MTLRTIATRSSALLALLFATTAGAMAQAHFYISLAQNGSTMHATATSDAGSAMYGHHTAYATVRLESPSGRQVQNSDNSIPSIVVDAYMDLGSEDGTFTADNLAWIFCDVANKNVAQGDPATTDVVNPWAYISAVSWSDPHNTIPLSNGSVNMDFTVSNSENCVGGASVQAHLSPPQGMYIQAGPPSTVPITLDRSGSQNGQIEVRTASGNSVSGTVAATASVQSLPGSPPHACTVMPGRDPANTPTLTVTSY